MEKSQTFFALPIRYKHCYDSHFNSWKKAIFENPAVKPVILGTMKEQNKPIDSPMGGFVGKKGFLRF